VEEPFSPPETRMRRRVASRLVSAELATYAIVLAVTAALLVYFFARG
jgi:hypothetical protein